MMINYTNKTNFPHACDKYTQILGQSLEYEVASMSVVCVEEALR